MLEIIYKLFFKKRNVVVYERTYAFEHWTFNCPDCWENLYIDTFYSPMYIGNTECWECWCKIKAVPRI